MAAADFTTTNEKHFILSLNVMAKRNKQSRENRSDRRFTVWIQQINTFMKTIKTTKGKELCLCGDSFSDWMDVIWTHNSEANREMKSVCFNITFRPHLLNLCGLYAMPCVCVCHVQQTEVIQKQYFHRIWLHNKASHKTILDNSQQIKICNM